MPHLQRKFLSFQMKTVEAPLSSTQEQESSITLASAFDVHLDKCDKVYNFKSYHIHILNNRGKGSGQL